MDHGHKTEETLEKICKHLFGSVFVYQSPMIDKESGKKVEMTDVLILSGDVLITIQSKSIDLEATTLSEIQEARIINRYEKAKKQINRTLNAASREQSVTLTTLGGFDFQLPWSMIKRKIGIITINLNDEAYSDPEYRYQIPLRYENHKSIDLHSFILRDLFVMLSEFNTVGDFISYLDERKFLLPKMIQEYTNDLDLVAVLKSNYEFVEKIKRESYDKIMIPPGTWEGYREELKEQIKKRDRKIFSPTIIDLLINEFSSNIDYIVEQNSDHQEEAIMQALKITGFLGQITRIVRVAIQERFHEKYLSTETENFRYFSLRFKNSAIFLLIVNEPNRNVRQDKLYAMTCALAVDFQKNPYFDGVEEIYSFSTNGRKLPGRSFDSIVLPISTCLESAKGEKFPQLFQFRDEGRIDEWTL